MERVENSMMKRVLIAEDERSIREMIVVNLKRNGYDVAEAENGEEALALYNEYNGNFDRFSEPG